MLDLQLANPSEFSRAGVIHRVKIISRKCARIVIALFSDSNDICKHVI